MNVSAPSRRVGRSILAVLAGLMAIFVVSMGTDAALHASGIFPPWFQPMAIHLWVVALAYRVVFGILCSYLVAWLAPQRPMLHAILFGAIGVVLSVLGVAANWNNGPEFGPAWFSIGLVAIALPCAWIGGAIRESQLHTRGAAHAA